MWVTLTEHTVKLFQTLYSENIKEEGNADYDKYLKNESVCKITIIQGSK